MPASPRGRGARLVALPEAIVGTDPSRRADVEGTLTGAGDTGGWRSICIPLRYDCAFCLGYRMAKGGGRGNSTHGDACTPGGQR